jgi:tetratricopeptide (TPR) repeat protein
MAGNALSNEDVAFLRERKFRNLEKTLCALPLGRNSVHVDMYVRAIAMGVESKEVYRNLARYYGQNDRKSDALEMYEKGIALDPEIKQWDTRDMVRSAAKLYKDTGNYRKAAVYYEKYLAFSRNVPDLCELAVCYKNLGDYGKALERLNEAIRMDQRGSYAEEIRSLKNEIYGGKDAAGERSSPGKRK